MSVTLPAPIPVLPAMETTPEGAVTVATDLRAVTSSVKESQSWAERGAAFATWQGDSREAADQAMGRFSRRLAAAEAALQDAATATDAFEDRLRRLLSQSRQLDQERVDHNEEIDVLRSAITSGLVADPLLAETAARRLQRQGEGLQRRIEAWQGRCQLADDDFIAHLRGLDSVREGRAAAADPGRPDPDRLSRELDDLDDDPHAVNRWWEGLSRAEKQALMMEYPDQVGNSDGVPVADRDEANRTAVERDLDYLGKRDADGQLSDDERDAYANAQAVRDTLEEYEGERDLTTGDHLANLIVYKPGAHSGDGGVAISLGDPDRADHVATYVPGTTSESSGIGGTMNNVEDLHQKALTENSGSVATMVYLDYDAPSADSFGDLDELADLEAVVTTGEAERGGRTLSDFIDGLRASDDGTTAHLTVIGHSYGATTVAEGAHDGADVDEVVLLGSPGAPTTTAAELTDAHVYVGAADYDPVSLLGLGARGGVGTLGYDPAQDTFGADRFAVDPGSYRVEDLIKNHSSYFDDESLDNIADVVTGHDPDVVGGRGIGYQNLHEVVLGSSAASGGERFWNGVEYVGDKSGDGIGQVGEGIKYVGGRASEGIDQVAEGLTAVGEDGKGMLESGWTNTLGRFG